MQLKIFPMDSKKSGGNGNKPKKYHGKQYEKVTNTLYNSSASQGVARHEKAARREVNEEVGVELKKV